MPARTTGKKKKARLDDQVFNCEPRKEVSFQGSLDDELGLSFRV
jgi:hypothetical protein